MTFMLLAGSNAAPYLMTRGAVSPWFTQPIHSRFFKATNWNVGPAYAPSPPAVCRLFIFLMMRFTRSA